MTSSTAPKYLRSLLFRLNLFLTRGSRFMIIERGLYLPSAACTLKAQASEPFLPGITGRAWVRFPAGRLVRNRKIHPVDAVLINGFGRFGNSIIQLLNARSIAEQWNVSEVLFHRFDLIKNQNLHLSSTIRLEKTSLGGRKTKPPWVIWATHALNGTHLIDEACSPANAGVRELLASAVAPQIARSKEHGVLTAHFRSGDIFGPNPHRRYGQPPLSFYQKVVLDRGWSRVDIISEDRLNPCSAALESWCREKNIPVTWSCLDLSQTIARVAGASNIVAGRGTFIPSIVFLFPGERSMFLFEPGEEPLLCDPKLTTQQVRDKQGHYTATVLDDNWLNSAQQRELMLQYPDESLTPLHSWTQK